MKILGILALALAANFAEANVQETRNILRQYKNECKKSSVVVEEIVKDSHIKGHVTGIPADAYEKFKVVFYVKTNRWYVHPYVYNHDQEPGYSFSNLDANGGFWVRTVRRQVPSKELAVVVVPRSYKILSQRWLLKPFLGIFGGITKDSCGYSIVPGNGDFFM